MAKRLTLAERLKRLGIAVGSLPCGEALKFARSYKTLLAAWSACDNQDWKDWLKLRRANANPPLPNTEDWPAWIAAHR